MLCLISADYFTRLWCVFEVAAFAHRSGDPRRLVLLPLHSTSSVLAALLLFSFIYAAGPVVIAIAFGGGEEAEGYVMFIGTIMVVTGSVPFALWLAASIEGQQVRAAIAGLKDFTLADAKCFDEGDRAAITNLIAEWFSHKDRSTGETDPVRLRALGLHRFETYVRLVLLLIIPNLACGHMPQPMARI